MENQNFNFRYFLLLAVFGAVSTVLRAQQAEKTSFYEDKILILGAFVSNGYYDLDEIDLGRYRNHGMSTGYGFYVTSTTRLWVGLEVHFSRDRYHLHQLERLDTSRTLIFTKEVFVGTLSAKIGFDILRRKDHVLATYFAYHRSSLFKGKDLKYGVYKERTSSLPPCHICNGGSLLNNSASSLSFGLNYKYLFAKSFGAGLSFEVNKVLQTFEKDFGTEKPFQPIGRISLFAIL